MGTMSFLQKHKVARCSSLVIFPSSTKMIPFTVPTTTTPTMTMAAGGRRADGRWLDDTLSIGSGCECPESPAGGGSRRSSEIISGSDFRSEYRCPMMCAPLECTREYACARTCVCVRWLVCTTCVCALARVQQRSARVQRLRTV